MKTEDGNADIRREILRLKAELNAVILAHYYQEGEIQDIADFVGDSLELARRAAATDARVIVFAGVHFMAETAKILNPRKQVLLPDLNAGCSLAEGCPAPGFAALRARYPDYVSITYINCSAEVKALSDIICTSSNAEKIIRQIPAEKKIFFAPDRNLGRYLEKKTGRPMLLWEGSCIRHSASESSSGSRLTIRVRSSSPTPSAKNPCWSGLGSSVQRAPSSVTFRVPPRGSLSWPPSRAYCTRCRNPHPKKSLSPPRPRRIAPATIVPT
jgi:quinolinate synthase